MDVLAHITGGVGLFLFLSYFGQTVFAGILQENPENMRSNKIFRKEKIFVLDKVLSGTVVIFTQQLLIFIILLRYVKRSMAGGIALFRCLSLWSPKVLKQYFCALSIE